VTLEQQIAQFVASGLVNGAIYALLGLGLVVIYSVTRVVNVAQGEFAALGALVAASLVARGLPYWLAIVLAIVATAVTGAGMHRFAIRPARKATALTLLIISIAVHLTLRGILLILWGTDPYSLPPFSVGPPLRLAGAVLNRQSIWVIGAALVILAGAYVFFTRTIHGKALRACAVNPTAARLYGIDVNAMAMQAFALAGALGGAAGVLITPLTLATYDMGLILGLKGFVGAVVVGFASYPWTVAACFAFGVVESLGAGLISSAYRDAIAFGVLVAVLLWRALAAAMEGTLVSEEQAQE
jgi:branched-chain amino acid transport system permease protein